MLVGYIKNVEFKNDVREVWVTLSNGGCVKICACCESWEQYHATTDEKSVSVGIADIVNSWLHGDSTEPWDEINGEIIESVTKWIKENDREVFGGIEDFELRRELAMSRMDRMRSPLRVVDSSLYDEMYDKLSEWCEENNFDVDDFNVEDIVF